jgi:hypothetical protein
MFKALLSSFSSIPSAPEDITSLALEAQKVLRLQVATDRIPYSHSLQHLTVRDEELYQRSIRMLERSQEADWLSGVLIPGTDSNAREQLSLYLVHEQRAYKVGRLRNSMVTPVFKQLMTEYSENNRVIPVIAKVAPGTMRSQSGVIAYAKTDLINFPTY